VWERLPIVMRISAITPGINVPSSRYRIRQYIGLLNEAGISVTEFPSKINYSSKLPGVLGRVKQRFIFPVSATWIGIKSISRISDIISSNRYDAVWLNRIIVSSLYMERYIRQPIIYDVDDAIWINNERIIRKIGEKARTILAGNSFIADWFSRVNNNIHIIPTAIDTSWFTPSEQKRGEVFSIVWTGSGQTIHYLLKIENALARFLNERNDTQLVVVSDVRPDFKCIKPGRISFIKWTPEAELDAIRSARVGIMPLVNSVWEQGKCSFKMLQYMSCGLPVLVSPVGMNNEVLKKGEIGYAASDENDWISGLEDLYNSPEKGINLGLNGRQVIITNYSLDKVAGSLIQIFRNIKS
jgi:glycosyltransferase involved in cell wall biosynthesis